MSGIVLASGGNWPPPPPISLRALLTPNLSNADNGQTFVVTQGADFAMPVDPCHEFPCVVTQLGGLSAVYPFGGDYPPVVNSGFVTSYAGSGGQNNPGEVMKCYGPDQLPVLNALAREFVVCDNWHASLPGPTWPNRFFVHAASSGGLDHSPGASDIALWDSVSGFNFSNGTIFDRLNSSGVPWRLYAGDNFPIVGALKGINFTDLHDYSNFASDVFSRAVFARYVDRVCADRRRSSLKTAATNQIRAR